MINVVIDECTRNYFTLRKGRVAWNQLGYLHGDVYTQGPFAEVVCKGWHNKG